MKRSKFKSVEKGSYYPKLSQDYEGYCNGPFLLERIQVLEVGFHAMPMQAFHEFLFGIHTSGFDNVTSSVSSKCANDDTLHLCICISSFASTSTNMTDDVHLSAGCCWYDW